MKNLVCLGFFLFGYFTIFSQQDTMKYFVNKIPLDSVKTEYIQIVGTSKFLSTKLTIELDFGQYDNLFRTSDTQLVNSKGKKVDLNSMIDALNFMVAHGYEYVNSYAISEGNQKVYHYLLRKTKNE